MPTLAEIRAKAGPAPLPQAKRKVTMIEGQHLADESVALRDELIELLSAVQAARDAEPKAVDDDERDGPPRKAGQRSAPVALPPRVDEIRARQAEILAELAQWQEEITLGGVQGGDWQRFKDAHPAREGNRQDLQYAQGECSSSAVFEDLGRYVKKWGDEDVAPGAWDEWLAERIIYADRRELVSEVVAMHENGVAHVPNSGTSSSTTEPSGTD